MMDMTNALRLSTVGALLVIMAAPAVAGDHTYLYCDDAGYHCYRSYHDDEHGFYQRDLYRSGYFHPEKDFSGWHQVCDPDGDRCYVSRRNYWDFHEYYRRHGYHWEN